MSRALAESTGVSSSAGMLKSTDAMQVTLLSGPDYWTPLVFLEGLSKEADTGRLSWLFPKQRQEWSKPHWRSR